VLRRPEVARNQVHFRALEKLGQLRPLPEGGEALPDVGPAFREVEHELKLPQISGLAVASGLE
jgi:hypothetical protein